jgi:hypothetical protein
MFDELRPIFEVVKEGRIIHLVSCFRRFKLFTIIYDGKSSIVAEAAKISNLDIIKDVDKIVKLLEDLI